MLALNGFSKWSVRFSTGDLKAVAFPFDFPLDNHHMNMSFLNSFFPEFFHISDGPSRFRDGRHEIAMAIDLLMGERCNENPIIEGFLLLFKY